MRKLIVILLLTLVVMGVSYTPTPAAIDALPTVCAWAGYGPQWMTMCLIMIAFEYGVDAWDYLHGGE